MSRKPSAETELRRVKRELRVVEASRESWRAQAHRTAKDKEYLMSEVKNLARKIADWERRFDLLLASKQDEA